ncbi:MAG: minor capsid protein [Clostridia bacterium]
MAKFTFDKDKVVTRLVGASEKAIFITSEQALKDCNVYCKEDQEGLINSSLTASEPEKGLLIWNEPYAKKQYYLDSTNTDKNPKARKMWAHYAKSVHGKEWLETMQKAFKEKAKK